MFFCSNLYDIPKECTTLLVNLPKRSLVGIAHNEDGAPIFKKHSFLIKKTIKDRDIRSKHFNFQYAAMGIGMSEL